MMKAIKNEPFDGQFFKRISEKVIFYGVCRRHAPFFCTKAETIRNHPFYYNATFDSAQGYY